MPTSDGDTPELKKNWVLSGVALLLGICVVALAVVDYIQSPPDHKGIEVGPIFIPLGPQAPSSSSHQPAQPNGGPSKSPKPGGGQSTLISGVSGTWVLQQATNSSQVDNPAVEAALSTPHIRGYSLRVPWSAIDGSTSLLDKGLRVARAHGLAFSARFMAGRWTPARVYAAGAPAY